MGYLGRWLLLGIHIVVVGACSPQPKHDDRPNILLIVADDLGYADLGVFGSDIRTPNIDALAREGVIFTQFHTSPVCAPTRAMLLTGNNNHVAGMGRQGGSPRMVNVPGYENHLSDRVAPMPRLLREAGYHTYIAGKWHLGTAPEHGPAAAGFEHSFTLLHGAGSHFSSTGFFEGGSLYREDEAEVEYPEGRYSTELFTDRLLEFINTQKESGRPFFAFAAYTSPHWPLQVPDEDLDLYTGRYQQGYDRLREERFESLKGAGIITPDSELPPRNEAIRPWDELTEEQRRREARKMELYAAMVENLDRHVGRLIDHLKATGLYENTLIVFMSDNGAAGEDFFHVGPFVDYLQEHYDNSFENMGRPTSWVSYGPQWAEAGSAPFSRYKGYTRQGGIQAPMIVSSAGLARRDEIDHSYLTVMDLAPTFLELAGARYPTDGSVRPMLGASMVDLLQGRADRVHGNDYVTVLHHGDRAFVRQGRWKLVNLEPPFAEEGLELFDLDADPGETTNLAQAEPEVLSAMLDLWRTTRAELGIVLENDPR
jgi:arylsulfatase A-like enzyme